jgi:TRAP-type C4-dicarboxylate transport system substrate-binding protein
MKHGMRTGSIVVLVAAGLLCASQTALAQTTWRFNQWLPATHFLIPRVWTAWGDEVAKVTGGRVKVELTGSSLGAPNRQYDMAGEGVADVVWGPHAITPGRFPFHDFVTLPFLGVSGESASVAYWRVYNKFYASKEAADEKRVKLLSLHVHPPGEIYSRKPTARLADLKGQKIRSVSANTTLIAQKFGMVPVPAPATKVYEMLSSGVTDATFFDTYAVVSYNLHQHVQHWMRVRGGLYTTSFFLAVGRDKWDALSPADQKAIEAVSGEAFARRAGRIWDEEAKGAEDLMVKRGVKVTWLEGAELEHARKELAPAERDWIEQIKSRGVDGAAVMRSYREEVGGYKP